VAFNSPEPPDKNIIPGTAAGTDLLKVLTVNHATLAGSAFSLQSTPGVIIFGLRRIASNNTPNLTNLLKTAENTLSDTSAHFSIV